MRALADADRVRAFMKALGRDVRLPADVYLTGGATAVLVGWRGSTIDIDVKFVPDRDELLRAIAAIKDALDVNVELASPDDFVPVRDGWQDRSPFVAQEGPLTFRHFDPEAQALAKIERGHAQDVDDVSELARRGFVTASGLRDAFAAIEPRLYRYPAIDPAGFRRAVDAVLAAWPVHSR